MSVEARSIDPDLRNDARDCAGCGGNKGAPLVGVISIYHPHSGKDGIAFSLCEECGRDAANAIGFLCIRDGGWSKIEPRKRKARKS